MKRARREKEVVCMSAVIYVGDMFREIADIWRTSGIWKGTLCAV